MTASSTSAIPYEQLSRTALLYLLAAFSTCILLLSIFLPWWLLPVAVSSVVWRLLVFSGRVSFPSLWIRVALVLMSGVLLLVQFGIAMSLDVFVMLLLLGFSLKLLELYRRPDAQILLYLAFFVLMTVFLFDQGPGYVILVFFAAFQVLAAMVAVQSAESELKLCWFQPLRKAAWVLVFSLPVMLFMFVVMPRLPPLWSMPLQVSQQGKTGIGDSMAPGDISSLAQSSDLVLRATFPDGIPTRHDLYWYGIIFDKFDGKRWTESCSDCRNQWQRSDLLPRSNAVNARHYQVILEPHGYKWLYTLMPSQIRDDEVLVNQDGIFRSQNDVTQRRVYEAEYLLLKAGKASSLVDRDRYLELPTDGNFQSRTLAQQWKHDAGKNTLVNTNVQVNVNAQVVEKALAFYREHFYYTLQPPPLGDQRVDDFLFNTRQGFCEHFASSFVFLMRAAGIPARVVLGYMGGEMHPEDHYVVVRQYDAHAWAEVWLPETGWQRVDPTAAVAPDRIDLGFADAYSGNSKFSLANGLAAYRHIPLLNSLRQQLDRLDYFWARWVLGYEGDQQHQLLEKLGLLSPLRIAAWGGGGVAFVFFLLCFYLYWREWWLSHEPLATRRYRQISHLYSLCGVARLPVETPLQYAQKINALELPVSDTFLQLSQQYYCWCYDCNITKGIEPSANFFAISRRVYWLLVWHVVSGKLPRFRFTRS